MRHLSLDSSLRCSPRVLSFRVLWIALSRIRELPMRPLSWYGISISGSIESRGMSEASEPPLEEEGEEPPQAVPLCYLCGEEIRDPATELSRNQRNHLQHGRDAAHRVCIEAKKAKGAKGAAGKDRSQPYGKGPAAILTANQRPAGPYGNPKGKKKGKPVDLTPAGKGYDNFWREYDAREQTHRHAVDMARAFGEAFSASFSQKQ